jgi:hypothetical protein
MLCIKRGALVSLISVGDSSTCYEVSSVSRKHVVSSWTRCSLFLFSEIDSRSQARLTTAQPMRPRKTSYGQAKFTEMISPGTNRTIDTVLKEADASEYWEKKQKKVSRWRQRN